MNLSNLVKQSGQLVKSNIPEILTALGVSGVITTSYLAGKASYKVARDEDAPPWMSNKEKIKRHWKLYIPTAVSGTLTIGCIIGASKATGRRTAAAVTAYSLTERAFSEYREKVVEEIGKGKEQKIRDQIVQDHIYANPVAPGVIVGGSGPVLCCELFTHRYFRSEMEALKRAENEINHKIVHQLYVTLDDFYDILGLAHTTNSGNLGWDSNKLLELKFSTVLSESNEPCIAFEYNYTKPLR